MKKRFLSLTWNFCSLTPASLQNTGKRGQYPPQMLGLKSSTHLKIKSFLLVCLFIFKQDNAKYNVERESIPYSERLALIPGSGRILP